MSLAPNMIEVAPYVWHDFFDDLNPALAKKCPALSEALDNVVVFVLPGR